MEKVENEGSHLRNKSSEKWSVYLSKGIPSFGFSYYRAVHNTQDDLRKLH